MARIFCWHGETIWSQMMLVLFGSLAFRGEGWGAGWRLCKGNNDSLKFVSQTIFKADRNKCSLDESENKIISIPSKSLLEQGWRSGESTCLPPMWPGFDSRTRRHMWVEFVVSSPPCTERFFSRYSGFPLSSKPSISKFQL